jgi:LCP family protein required for cell wall assembly
MDSSVQASTLPIIPLGSDDGAEEGDIVQQQERVNILLLGIDQREGEEGPWRTDTMILVSIDPANGSAAMLSIPRDLWVTIPGYSENRINTAHFTGDAQDYPGGGPALAKKTVWYAFGVPVDYYVRIKFTGVEQMLDLIGGVDIDVAEAIYDPEYPDDDYGTFVLEIPAGEQHMDGKTALQYARSRHGNADGDFGRMAHQQQVLFAVRDKFLSLDIPLSRIPKLLEVLEDSVKTDIPLDQITALAEAAAQIDRSQIRQGVIDATMTTSAVTPSGAMVQVGYWDKIRAMVDELFPVTTASPVPEITESAQSLADEAARIVVENGTMVPGLAARTATTRLNEGYDVVRHDSANRQDYARTLIVDYSGKPQTVRALAAALGVAAENVLSQAGDDPNVDGASSWGVITRNSLGMTPHSPCPSSLLPFLGRPKRPPLFVSTLSTVTRRAPCPLLHTSRPGGRKLHLSLRKRRHRLLRQRTAVAAAYCTAAKALASFPSPVGAPSTKGRVLCRVIIFPLSRRGTPRGCPYFSPRLCRRMDQWDEYVRRLEFPPACAANVRAGEDHLPGDISSPLCRAMPLAPGSHGKAAWQRAAARVPLPGAFSHSRCQERRFRL